MEIYYSRTLDYKGPGEFSKDELIGLKKIEI